MLLHFEHAIWHEVLDHYIQHYQGNHLHSEKMI